MSRLTGIVSHWPVVDRHRRPVSIDSNVFVRFGGIAVATHVQEAAARALNVTGRHPTS